MLTNIVENIECGQRNYIVQCLFKLMLLLIVMCVHVFVLLSFIMGQFFTQDLNTLNFMCRAMNCNAIWETCGTKLISVCINRKMCDVSTSEVCKHTMYA